MNRMGLMKNVVGLGWIGRKMGELYGGREAEIGRSLKSKRVQESRDRESAEGSENSIRIVAPARGFWGA